MATFISVPLKKTSEVDLAKPLVKFIQQTYPSGGEEQAQHCRAAEELSKLRRAALGRPLDKHEGALETLLRWAPTGRAPPTEGRPPPSRPAPRPDAHGPALRPPPASPGLRSSPPHRPSRGLPTGLPLHPRASPPAVSAGPGPPHRPAPASPGLPSGPALPAPRSTALPGSA